jgi:ABC-type transport system involved in multi-copper enzyme maturation permease subunit
MIAFLLYILVRVVINMIGSQALGVAGLAIIFITPYILFTAYYAMQQAAREIARNPDPAPALRERMETIQEDWQRAIAPPPTVYLPSPTGPYTYTAQVAPRPRKPRPATYGKQPFLPDRLNPVYAKDMRGGLVGKLDYLFRFSYIVTIGTELLLPIALLSDLNASASNWFGGWANLHLMLLLTAGAWLGARTIAPEREQQTLPQLLMAPLLPTEIVRGKMMAAMTYTFNVFMLSLPLALLQPLLGEMAWSRTFGFIAAEVVLGAFAAAWGIYCSMVCSTVRRAIGCALGGILFLVLAGSFFDILFVSSYALSPVGDFALRAIEMLRRLLPFDVLHRVLPSTSGNSGPNGIGSTATLLLQAILLYGSATLILLSLTSRAFRHYARTV